MKKSINSINQQALRQMCFCRHTQYKSGGESLLKWAFMFVTQNSDSKCCVILLKDLMCYYSNDTLIAGITPQKNAHKHCKRRINRCCLGDSN